MFKTIVLACSLLVPEQCWEYNDTRGPYETREQCQKRAYEMSNMIAEINEGTVMAQKFKCVQLKGMQL